MENLRVTYPQYFEIDTTSDLNGSRVGKQYQVHSVELQSLCARVHDDVALFKEMTISEELVSVFFQLSCWILMLATQVAGKVNTRFFIDFPKSFPDPSMARFTIVTNSVRPMRKSKRRSSLWFLFHYFIAYKIQYSYNKG